MDINDRDERRMDCEQLAVALLLAADDELSPDDRLLMETHLAGCPACRTQSALFHRTDQQLLAGGEALEDTRSVLAARARLMDSLATPSQAGLVSWLHGTRTWPWAAIASLSLAAAMLCITMTPRPVDRESLSNALSAGSTEVVRVELPLSPVGDPFLDGSQSESVVLADVVFGPDGLPRTVRLADVNSRGTK